MKRTAFRLDPLQWWHFGVVAMFVILTSFGITTSSVGISNLTFSGETHEDVLFGSPLNVRSDEWSRNTPQRLGIMRVGSEVSNPLSVGSYGEYGQRDGLVAAVVYADNTLSRLGTRLPTAQLFAFLWWLPYVVIAWSVPFILRFLGVRPSIAVASAALIIVSPAITWWTTMAPLAAAVVFGAAALLVWSITTMRSGRRTLAVGLACAAGIVGARAVLVYPRWTLPLALIVLVPLVVHIIATVDRRLLVVPFSVTILVAVTAVVAIIGANLDALVALRDTVSPGQVRVGGGGESLYFLLSAHLVGVYLPMGLPVVGSNQSELATGLLLLPAVLGSFFMVSRRRLNPNNQWFAFWSAGMVGVLLAWVLLPWPEWSASVPLFSVLKPQRVAQIIGVGGILMFAVLLERLIASDGVSKRDAAFLGLATAFVTVIVGMMLAANETPSMSFGLILVVSLGVGLAIGLAVTSRTLALGLVGLVAISGVGAMFANPVMAGLGDMDGPEFDALAVEMAEAVGEGYIASDTPDGNALVLAAGVPALSGDQVAPSAQWLKLDPQRARVDAWNRSAIVVFKWDPSLATAVIESPQADGIRVHVSPCSPVMAELGLRAILSASPLEAPCLEFVDSFGWNNGTVTLYVIEPG